MKTGYITWFERSGAKKRRFRELYGRKPTREEIKLLRKNRIHLGPQDPMELQKFAAPYHNNGKIIGR